MDIDQAFNADTVDFVRHEIARASGREVLFLCRLDVDGAQVVAAEVGARGHASAVPAPANRSRRTDVVVHNHPSGDLTPSDADLAVASRLAADGTGFWIINNAVSDLYVVTEAGAAGDRTPIDADHVAALVSVDGPFARLNPQFEERESQVAMVRVVAEAFNAGHVAAVEAGTGVGKSLGYLLPALESVRLNGGRVVVSTATIALQQQLIDKDIPTAQRLLADDLRVELVKGRGNYLCLNRLREAVAEAGIFAEDDDQLIAIGAWAETTADGTRSDLPFVPAGALWSRVNADPDACLPQRCPARDRCFFLAARRAAASADVLVANHHVLFADLSMRVNGFGFDGVVVLPSFDSLIIDEAHNIERNATAFFSRSLTRFDLAKPLARLWRQRGRRTLGLLADYAQIADIDLAGGLQRINAVRSEYDAFERRAGDLLADTSTMRLHAAIPQHQLNEPFLEPLRRFQTALVVLCSYLTDLLQIDFAPVDSADATAESDPEPLQPEELRAVIRRLEALAGTAEAARSYGTTPDMVVWLQQQRSESADFAAPAFDAGRRSFVVLTVSPLSIAPMLQAAVFEPMRVAVFSSATLTIDGSFEYWAQRIGLGQVPVDRRRTIALPSPFDYRARVLLAVPADAPSPDIDRYHDYLGDLLGTVFEISDGRGLALFTSYSMLMRAYDSASPRLIRHGLRVLRQGEDDRSRLLQRFRDDTSSVLFATDSFWEGVDAPGNTLEVVVICRLPFRVPTDPVLAARADFVTARGGNAFMELMLPEAVMRTKQGFGRLMRRSSDRGVVIIADPRAVTKYYGKVFVRSLPECSYCFEPTERVYRRVEEFLSTPAQ